VLGARGRHPPGPGGRWQRMTVISRRVLPEWRARWLQCRQCATIEARSTFEADYRNGCAMKQRYGESIACRSTTEEESSWLRETTPRRRKPRSPRRTPRKTARRSSRPSVRFRKPAPLSASDERELLPSPCLGAARSRSAVCCHSSERLMNPIDRPPEVSIQESLARPPLR
jgi:hypothetical protein